MTIQVSKEKFAQALEELGHNPDQYEGKRLTLDGMCKLYELDQNSVLEAIDQRHVAAHYDYKNDAIWIDALDAAHFYFCVQSSAVAV